MPGTGPIGRGVQRYHDITRAGFNSHHCPLRIRLRMKLTRNGHKGGVSEADVRPARAIGLEYMIARNQKSSTPAGNLIGFRG